MSLAAAGLGWQATLLDDLGSDAVAALLGVAGDRDACHRALRKVRQLGDMLVAP